MSRRLLTWALVAAVATPAAPLAAQASFGIAAGYSGASGDFGKAVNAGYHVGASLQLSHALSPIRARFDAGLSDFKYKSLGRPASLGDAKARVLSATADAVLAPAQLGGAYIIGGVGLYRMTSECSSCSTSATKGGVNGGVGYDIRLTGFTVFAEARYHYIAGPSDPTNAGVRGSNTQFFPISVGLRF